MYENSDYYVIANQCAHWCRNLPQVSANSTEIATGTMCPRNDMHFRQLPYKPEFVISQNFSMKNKTNVL